MIDPAKERASVVEARRQRRLAAILVADVAGYSRLMAASEEGTLTALQDHIREFIEPLIAHFGGRIVKTTGDGILAEFASAVAAAECAVGWQEGMAGRHGAAAPEWRIEFRIGLHVDDVMVEARRSLGWTGGTRIALGPDANFNRTFFVIIEQLSSGITCAC
jgi:class 3 adenylate cyclase